MKIVPPVIERAVLEGHNENDQREPALADAADQRIDPLRVLSIEPQEHERIHDHGPAMQWNIDGRVFGQHLVSGSYHSADGQCGAGSRAIACRGNGSSYIESHCAHEVETARPDHTHRNNQRQDRRGDNIDFRRSAGPITDGEHDKDNQIEQLIEASADVSEDDR
jgi:hypothetical protein